MRFCEKRSVAMLIQFPRISPSFAYSGSHLRKNGEISRPHRRHRADAAYSSIFHSVLMACVIQIESTDA
jgi:hypothetical protein